MQESGFWEGLDLHGLEALRLRLRRLVPFLDKKKHKIVYTDFEDQVIGVRDEEVVHMPKMTGVQYEKKVKDYLRNHLDHIVIHRLRTNQPLTATDLQGLETTLAEIGEDDGQTLLTGLLARSEGALAGPLRAEHGGDGSRCGAERLLRLPLRPEPHAAADPLRRDGDRPAYGPRRDGGIGSLRTALQQPACRGAGGIVWRKDKT